MFVSKNTKTPRLMIALPEPDAKLFLELKARKESEAGVEISNVALLRKIIRHVAHSQTLKGSSQSSSRATPPFLGCSNPIDFFRPELYNSPVQCRQSRQSSMGC